MKLFSHRRGVSLLSRLQDKLAEIVLVKRPMCFGGLIKREAPRDMDLERRQPLRFDKAIEFLDRLRVGHSVVRLGINAKWRLGHGFDAVGISDASTSAHPGKGLVGRGSTGGDSRCQA